MGSISHAITNSSYLNFPHLTSNRSSQLLRFSQVRVTNKVGVFAELSTRSSNSSCTAIDFNDPDWKTKFKQDFEARFRLPHITEIFPDAPPIPSTFCLKMRFVFFTELNWINVICWWVFWFFWGVTELRLVKIFQVIFLLMRSGMDTLITMTECFSRYAGFYLLYIHPLLLLLEKNPSSILARDICQKYDLNRAYKAWSILILYVIVKWHSVCYASCQRPQCLLYLPCYR